MEPPAGPAFAPDKFDGGNGGDEPGGVGIFDVTQEGQHVADAAVFDGVLGGGVGIGGEVVEFGDFGGDLCGVQSHRGLGGVEDLLGFGTHFTLGLFARLAFGPVRLQHAIQLAPVFFAEGLLQLALQAFEPFFEEPGPAPVGLDLGELDEPAHFAPDLGGERGEYGVVFSQGLDEPGACLGLACGLSQRCGQCAIGCGPFGCEPEPDAVLGLCGGGGLRGGGFLGVELRQGRGVGVLRGLDLLGVGTGVLGSCLGLGADLCDQGGELALGVLVNGDARRGVALEGVHLRGELLGVGGGAEGEGNVDPLHGFLGGKINKRRPGLFSGSHPLIDQTEHVVCPAHIEPLFAEGFGHGIH